MDEILIIRRHGVRLEDARASIESVVAWLRGEFGLDCVWRDNALHFRQVGLAGVMELDEREVALTVHLSRTVLALKPGIESAVMRFLDEHFPTSIVGA